MPLPKIEYPILSIFVPSQKKDYNFRPMLVKEEKILLMAKASEDDTDIFNAVYQVINNCSLDDSLDMDKLAIFDLEYLFLRIRAASIGETTDVSFRDTEDEKTYDFTIPLDQVNIIFPDVSNTIKITDTSGFTMRYPAATLYTDKEFLNLKPEEVFDHLVITCIDKIFDGEQVYTASMYTKDELAEFVEGLSIKAYDEIRNFFSNIPHMEYKIEYTNKMGSERTITLRNLSDFFILR